MTLFLISFLAQSMVDPLIILSSLYFTASEVFDYHFNEVRYINNNVTKDRVSIAMDMTIVLGPHKISLQVIINHHAPSMYSGHYTTAVNC